MRELLIITTYELRKNDGQPETEALRQAPEEMARLRLENEDSKPQAQQTELERQQQQQRAD